MGTSVAISKQPGHSARVADTFARSVGWMALLLVVQRGIGFARSFYVCDVLTPSEVGLWDLSFSFLMTLAPLAVLGIPGSFGRYIAVFETRGGLSRFGWQSLLVCLSLSLLAATVVIYWQRPLARWILGSAEHHDLMALLGCGLPVLVMFNYAVTWYSGLRLNRLVFRIQFAQCILFAALCALCFSTWETTGAAVVAAYLLSCLFGVLLAASYGTFRFGGSGGTVGSAKPDAACGVWQKILPFAFWVWTSNALINLFAVCDRFLIVNWIAESEVQVQALVGQYHSSRIIPLLLVTVGAMAGSMATPYLSKDWETDNKALVGRRLNMLVKSIGVLCCFASAGALFVAPVLFQGLWEGKFAMGQSLLPWTLSYCGLAAMTLVAQKYFWVLERTWWSSVAMSVGILVNLALGILLAGTLGIQGIVAATWVAHLGVFGVVMGLGRRAGMRWSPGVVLIAALLAASAWSGWISLLGAVLVAGLAVGTEVIFDADEKQQMVDRVSRFWRRAGGAS